MGDPQLPICTNSQGNRGSSSGHAFVPGVEVVGVDEVEVLVVLPPDHGVVAVDPSREEGHALVARSRTCQRRHREALEVGGLEQLRPDRPAAVGGVGRVEGPAATVVELDEAGVLDAVRLRLRDRKDHALADVALGLEYHFDDIPGRRGNAPLQVWDGRKPRGGIHGHGAVGRDASRSECQRGHVAFPDGTQAHDDTALAALRRGLIRMRDHAGIEQGGGFEGILVQEVGADELALYLRQRRMHGVNDLDGVGARLEGRQEPAVAPLEVLEHVRQLSTRGLRIERQDPLDNVRHPPRVRRVEIPRLDARPVVAHDHSRWIWTQTEGLMFE